MWTALPMLFAIHVWISGGVQPTPLLKVTVVKADDPSLLARFHVGSHVLLPRGADYIRLNRTSIGDGELNFNPSEVPLPAYHSTFSVGKYNRTQADTALRKIAGLGFNMVRVFIDDGRTFCGAAKGSERTLRLDTQLVPVLPCSASTARSNGVGGAWDAEALSHDYMNNFADFLRLATQYKIWIMPTFQRLPCTKRFLAMSQPRNPNISDGNADYLDLPTVRAKAAYLREFASALKKIVGESLMSTIFAYSLENEARAYGNEPPFSDPTLSSIVLSDGNSYNMADAISRRTGLDNSYAVWANTIAAAVREVDPAALVTAGMFTYYALGHKSVMAPGTVTTDDRFPPNPAHLSKHTSLSYLDIHIYPGRNFNLDDDIASEDFPNIQQHQVPVLLGEYGTFKKFYPTTELAAAEPKAVMLRTCKEYGFQGWLAWTFDTYEQDWMLWSLMDQDAYIGRALSPHNFSDPCFDGEGAGGTLML